MNDRPVCIIQVLLSDFICLCFQVARLVENDKMNSHTFKRKVAEPDIEQNDGNSLNNSHFSPQQRARMNDREEREKIVLWRQPLRTLYYFFLEFLILMKDYGVQ
jgi:hypothetical protein